MIVDVDVPPEPELLQIEKSIYGGDGLARRANGEVVMLPFVLPGEVVEYAPSTRGASVRVLEPSPERVQPHCIHFGTCGGCQYQMAGYSEQLRLKAAILHETLTRAVPDELPAVQVLGSPEPWGYRNKIRLRVRTGDGVVRLGYSIRGSDDFLAISMCPIAAPVLWATAEALIAAAAAVSDAAQWLRSAAEVEIACDENARRVGIHLLCPARVPQGAGSFDRFAKSLETAGIPVISMGASRLHRASGQPLEELAVWGPDGLAYRTERHSFWLKRGSFFQVNRFLVPAMVEVVCGKRAGVLAWDLYAGVGLFARALAERFEQVTAVEASQVAIRELRRGLRRPGDAAVGETTSVFLRKAAVQRERPDLVVLDPPRAGAGEETCKLLARLAPAEIVYVSCDPTTLARDLAVLTRAGYAVAQIHTIDLFPQTYHLETVIALHRTVMGR